MLMDDKIDRLVSIMTNDIVANKISVSPGGDFFPLEVFFILLLDNPGFHSEDHNLAA